MDYWTPIGEPTKSIYGFIFFGVACINFNVSIFMETVQNKRLSLYLNNQFRDLEKRCNFENLFGFFKKPVGIVHESTYQIAAFRLIRCGSIRERNTNKVNPHVFVYMLDCHPACFDKRSLMCRHQLATGNCSPDRRDRMWTNIITAVISHCLSPFQHFSLK